MTKSTGAGRGTKGFRPDDIRGHRERFMGHVDTSGECWLWLRGGNPKWPYGHYSLFRRIQGAHRASYQLFIGTIPEGMCVCHRCDTPACVRPAHLFVGTARDNARDMAKKERSPKTKLTAEQVSSILRERSDGETLCSIATKYGVTHGNISQIVSGASWKHIPR